MHDVQKWKRAFFFFGSHDFGQVVKFKSPFKRIERKQSTQGVA